MKLRIWIWVFASLFACKQDPTPQEEIRDGLINAAKGCSQVIYSNARIRTEIVSIIDHNWGRVEDYVYSLAATTSPIPSIVFSDGSIFHAVLNSNGYALQLTTSTFHARVEFTDIGSISLLHEYELRDQILPGGTSFRANYPTVPGENPSIENMLRRCSFGNSMVERKTLTVHEGSGGFPYLVGVDARANGVAFSYQDDSSDENDSRLCKNSECFTADEETASEIRKYFLNFPTQRVQSALVGFNVDLYYLLNDLTNNGH